MNVRLVEKPVKLVKILSVVKRLILNVTRRKARETHEASQSRKQANSECHARKRACETHEESQSHKQANSECQARKRAHETREQSQNRIKANSKRQASS